MTEQLAFNMQSNKVVVSCELDADCQEVSSQTPSRTAQQQRTNTLPNGVLLDDFPGTAAEKRQAERIFREYADVFTREGEELGCTSITSSCITESTRRMMFQSTNVTGRFHPTSSKRCSSICRNC